MFNWWVRFRGLLWRGTNSVYLFYASISNMRAPAPSLGKFQYRRIHKGLHCCPRDGFLVLSKSVKSLPQTFKRRSNQESSRIDHSRQETEKPVWIGWQRPLLRPNAALASMFMSLSFSVEAWKWRKLMTLWRKSTRFEESCRYWGSLPRICRIIVSESVKHSQWDLPDDFVNWDVFSKL